ncbi:MAG: hypothetical protein PHX18_06495 [Candidatus Gastranaerophilales bacterium]|nr:hypothetical protein [Candidatus Gastranaerophilales bacterium]
MLKINRIFSDNVKMRGASEQLSADPDKLSFSQKNCLLRLISFFLPVQKKFAREVFVAKRKNKVLAKLALTPDSFSKSRWQFTSLMFKEKHKQIAKTLIDYVVNYYGGAGASTFLAYVDETNPQMISVLKNECLFRNCAKIEFLTLENLASLNIEYDLNDFRDVNVKDSEELLEINTSNIFTHYRPALISDLGEFKLNKSHNNIFKVFAPKGNIAGYFRLCSNNKKDFYLDVITSKPYEQCYLEMLGCIKDIVLEQNNEASLTVYLKKYRQTAGKLKEVLEELGFNFSSSTQILVKDYWQRIPVKNEMEEKLFVLFNDIKGMV